MCGSVTWQNVLVQWVNCLALQDNPIQQVKELRDGRFFHSILNAISHKTKHSISTDEANEEVTSFLKYEYPNYCMDAESCVVEDDTEITYITSLLLLHSVLRSENKRIMDHMYNLGHETQICIKNFFEIVLQYDGNITRSVLKHAINEYGNNTSPKATGKGHHCSESPLISFSTPKRPPIKDVVESPLAQKLKQLSEQRAVIKRLNNELEVEQMEKVELQEELRQQCEKTKKLTKELTDKNEEIKKLREEWLCNTSESCEKSGCVKSCQEALLKEEIKSLEAYISSVHADMDTLHKEQDLLKQRLFKAEHQYNVWHTKSQEYEAQCEHLQHDLVEKELELAQVKELCSDLQSHVQKLKQVCDSSVEEDNCINPECRTPENLGQAVVDLQLREKEEENEALSEQLKRMIMKEEEMAKCISDLELHLETANHEAGSLKTSNIELVNKVEALQHELEESERKLNSASVELDHISQEQILLEKGLAGIQDLLACKDNELSDSHNVAESLTSDLAKLQDKFLETQKILAAEVEHVAKLDLEAHETQKQLKRTSQELADIKMENTEVKQNLGCIEQQLGQNVKWVEGMLLSGEDTAGDAEQSRADGTEGSLAALCLSVGAKVERLNFLLIDLDAKNLKSLHERSNLESSCKELNESIIKLCGEINDREEREQTNLLQKSMLEECLQSADENISSLQTKVSEYTHKIENFNSMLEDKKTEIEHLEGVRQSLSDRNEKLQKLSEEKAEKLQRFETELTEVTQDKILLQDQYNKMKEFSEENISSLQTKLSEYTHKIENLNSVLEDKKTEIEHLEGDRQRLSDRNEKLEKLSEEKAEKLQRFETELTEVTQDKILLQDQYNKMKEFSEENISSLQTKVSEYTHKIENLNSVLEDKKTEIELLEGDRQHLSDRNEKLEKLSEEKAEKLQRFETELTKVTQDKILLQDQYNKMKEFSEENISSLQTKVSECTHKIENLNSVLEDKKTEIEHLEGVRQSLSDRNEKLEKLSEEKAEKLQRFETELTEVTQDKILLQDQYNKMEEFSEENISSLQTKVSEYTHKIENLNSVLEDKKTEIEHLEGVRQSLSDRNEKLEKLSEEKAEKLQRFETELTEVTQDKILLQDQYNKMKEFSEEQTETVNMLNCKIAELEKQIQDLVQERDSSNSNLQNINCKLQELQASKENVEQSYSNAMQENEESIQRLNGHVSVLKDRINELEKRVALADEQLECLKENLAEMNKNKDILKLQYDTENQETGEQIELLNQHVRKLETTVAELEEEKKGIICKLKSAEEEKCLQLGLESQKTSEIKQAYETLLEVNYKLQSENEDLKSKMEEKMKAIRQEYEKKLDRLKAKMRILYEEEIGKKIKKSKEESEHLQAMCKIYKDKIQSYENDVGILKSQVWEIGDKLLMAEREKKKLEEELSKRQIFLQSIGKQDDFLERRTTLSNLERGRKIGGGSSTEVHTMDIIDESVTLVRRKKSVPRTLPSGMGAMFNPEDEEGEVFNTTNLADLKMGRCLPEVYKGRVSELQYRNSLCPPHLKSSYPAETQFHDPLEYRDEDLKLGCAVDVDQFDALSTSMLLPSEKQRKKDRGQTSYKKPGPPTPGKNGGRLSFQGTEVLTPRAPLRESNDGACVRKASTPSRLKSLFTNKNRRDENTPVTPRGRRLSNIFRRQVKNHQ